ncbi:MAG: alkaline phosphatase [Firmicutes bacterium]|nr:alkaline phosphatase [Bacillota bacterium]
MKKRIVSAVLVILSVAFIFPAFAGCGAASLSEYKIVYSMNATGLEKHAAEFLSDYIFETSGIRLEVSNDAGPVAAKEIVIGQTNRAVSDNAAKLTYGKNDVLVRRDGRHIVLYGNDLMIAGAVGTFASQHVTDEGAFKGVSSRARTTQYQQVAAKNIVLLIGDGMGFNHIELAKTSASTFKFFGEMLPNHGEMETESLGLPNNPSYPPCSASNGTAIATGTITYANYVGVDKDGNSVKNITEIASENGYQTAIVTTDIDAGATPASFSAHINNRNNYTEIRAQQEGAKRAGTLNYLKGTGSNPNQAGTPNGGAMQEYVVEALWQIRGEQGFFIMIEDDDIDNWSHQGNSLRIPNVINAVRRFNEAVAYAVCFALAHPGTAIIVTADHETGGLTRNANGQFNFTSVIHSFANVPIFAFGAGSEIFNEQTHHLTKIFDYMNGVITS